MWWNIGIWSLTDFFQRLLFFINILKLFYLWERLGFNKKIIRLRIFLSRSTDFQLFLGLTKLIFYNLLLTLNVIKWKFEMHIFVRICFYWQCFNFHNRFYITNNILITIIILCTERSMMMSISIWIMIELKIIIGYSVHNCYLWWW